MILIDMFECTLLHSYQRIRNSETGFRKMLMVEYSQMINTRVEQLFEAMVLHFIIEFRSGKLYPEFAHHLGSP